MKRLFLSLLFVQAIVLIGCSSNGPVDAVKDMYSAAIKGDQEKFDQYHAYSDNDYIQYQEDAIVEYGEHFSDLGGVSNIEFSLVDKKDLDIELVEDYDEDYGENWDFVIAEREEEDYYDTYVLRKIDSEYYIMEEDSLYTDEFLK